MTVKYNLSLKDLFWEMAGYESKNIMKISEETKPQSIRQTNLKKQPVKQR